VYLSSESDSDPFPRASRASAHRSDGREVTDEGHEADDETNTRGGRHEQQTDVNARADPIELKELKRSTDGPSRVDATYFFSMHALIISLKVTISASPETTSAPRLPGAFGTGVASPQTPETKQSALPPLNTSPRDGLRRRTTARCDYICCLFPRSRPTLICFIF
jgi:hypothetical protein